MKNNFTIEKVKEFFYKEFSFLQGKFVIYNLPISKVKCSEEEHVWRPGVYVFWASGRVEKVGRHLTNSRKRALEHIQANTGGSMRSLKDNPSTRVLLFNVKDTKDLHWVAALEVFFELKLKPEIKSKRLG